LVSDLREEVDSLKCHNMNYKNYMESFDQQLDQFKQEVQKEAFEANQKIEKYQNLAYAIEEDGRVRLEECQRDAEF
jgi:predicted RNase H-like nuclease (RuvC/YqgF family)